MKDVRVWNDRYGLLEISRRFESVCCLQLQGKWRRRFLRMAGKTLPHNKAVHSRRPSVPLWKKGSTSPPHPHPHSIENFVTDRRALHSEENTFHRRGQWDLGLDMLKDVEAWSYLTLILILWNEYCQNILSILPCRWEKIIPAKRWYVSTALTEHWFTFQRKPYEKGDIFCICIEVLKNLHRIGFQPFVVVLTCLHIQVVPRVKVTTSGECSLC
jgi:hypothetical protein